ncbi:MAG: DUF2227 family putative metal-binding protein [Bacteriovoracaceae bacterium]|jgi:uncharacterized metal-binding protein|nr:DUF2227 family putative metal-binding protein [Bacteriovoracaceae bacterium]
MSSGKFHDKINLLTGAILTGALIGFERSAEIVLSFVMGWLIATFIFSPDTDIMPKKRTGPFQFLLYPYSILFKHRGISHSFLLGTAIRILYSVILFGIILFVLYRMKLISYSGQDYLFFIKSFIQNWDLSLLSYKIVSWFFVGMFVSDIHHYCVDIMTSLLGKLRRLFFK